MEINCGTCGREWRSNDVAEPCPFCAHKLTPKEHAAFLRVEGLTRQQGTLHAHVDVGDLIVLLRVLARAVPAPPDAITQLHRALYGVVERLIGLPRQMLLDAHHEVEHTLRAKRPLLQREFDILDAVEKCIYNPDDADAVIAPVVLLRDMLKLIEEPVCDYAVVGKVRNRLHEYPESHIALPRNLLMDFYASVGALRPIAQCGDRERIIRAQVLEQIQRSEHRGDETVVGTELLREMLKFVGEAS